jgi:hypothetical protein
MDRSDGATKPTTSIPTATKSPATATSSPPSVMPGATWISLLPPGVVAALGGLDSVTSRAPVHRLEPLQFHNESVGALAQVTANASDFDGEPEMAWRRYLATVLRQP